MACTTCNTCGNEYFWDWVDALWLGNIALNKVVNHQFPYGVSGNHVHLMVDN